MSDIWQSPVSKSLLHIGDVVVRRQDTSSARVHMMEPLVGDMRVAQVFDPRDLLPSSFGDEYALQTPESSQACKPRKRRLKLRRIESALPVR